MSLSADERARIIETLALRTDVESELRPIKSQPKISDFSKQLILLILGSALTTLAGGALTYLWKERDQTNQRSYLAEKSALDKKYSLIDKTFKEVALTTAAAEDVLASYYEDKLDSKDIAERMANWHLTSRNWRVASRVLSPSLESSFENSEIGATFQKIIDTRKMLGNEIMNLDCRLGDNKCYSAHEPKLKQQLKEATGMVNEIGNLLRHCGELMVSETKTKSVT